MENDKIGKWEMLILLIIAIILIVYLSSIPKDEFCRGLIHWRYWGYCAEFWK